MLHFPEKKPIIPQILGLSEFSSTTKYDSSPRARHMAASQRQQTVVPINSDLPFLMHGYEHIEGEFTYSITMPVDAIIIAIIPKYSTHSLDINYTPTITIIYQDYDTFEYGCLDITSVKSNHDVFGYYLEVNPLVYSLRPQMTVAKGTILAKTNNIKENLIGESNQKSKLYGTGFDAKVAFMPHPSTIEDGIGISEEFAERCRVLKMGSNVLSFGRNSYPLNLYGDDKNYKICPDIGEYIRSDGAIFGIREYHPNFDFINFLPKNLRSIQTTDYIVYAKSPGAKVYDINIHCGIGEQKGSTIITPKNMVLHLNKGINELKRYYAEILNIYHRYIYPNKHSKITGELHNLIKLAIADKPNDHSKTSAGIIKRTFKQVPLDEYRIEVKYCWEAKAAMGFKIAVATHGGKGVVCEILPNEKMPVDKNGNRAEVIFFPKSPISRLIPGMNIDHYLGANCLSLEKWVKDNYGKIENNQIWEMLLYFYDTVMPIYSTKMRAIYNDNDIDNHIKGILVDKIYISFSTSESDIKTDIHDHLSKKIPLCYDKVKYVNNQGKVIESTTPVLIGKNYLYILEQSDITPMAISSGLLQNFGLISGLTKQSRVNKPMKVSAVKAISEAEAPLYSNTMGEAFNIHMNISNNPELHAKLVKKILTDPNSVSVEPFKKEELTNSRPIKLVTHILNCMGIEVNKGLNI